MELARAYLQRDPPVIAYYRDGSSDLDAIHEVNTRHAYRRKKDGFDVEPGERWLDLGANIGAFALYCLTRGAIATCYEPEPTCFSILEKNAPDFEKFNAAVTDQREKQLTFYESKNPDNHYRTTTIPVKRYQKMGEFANVYAGNLMGYAFDGLKIDIEGSEFGLIDSGWLLPKSNKLVMELHTSRDSNPQNCAQRLESISERYKQVHYPKALTDFAYKGGERPRYDQIVFGWN